MEYDGFFRLALIIGLAVILPIVAYYRFKAHAQPEKISHQPEGWSLFVGIRLASLVSVVGLIAYFIDPEYVRFAQIELPFWIRVLGLLIGVLGGALWIMTFHFLGHNLTDTVVARTNATLVTNGPYRYIRHPLYSAFALIAIANGLATANWLIFSGTFFVFLLLCIRTIKEEAKLIEKFGDAYRAYMKKTGRFFPRF